MSSIWRYQRTLIDDDETQSRLAEALRQVALTP